MATVYSLVCFGGRTGKTATMTIANPCVVTLTNHGLRDGFGVVFSTSGALPTGVTAGTTYYAKSTAASTFNLYDTSANAIAGGTTGRVTTTGSQSGTHTIKSAYRNGLTSGQLLRYGTAGSERIYDSLDAFNTGRSGASAFDTEICEISDAFTTLDNYSLILSVPCASLKITTEVNGVRSQAFHNGSVATTGLSAGFILKYTQTSGEAIRLSKYYQEIDGFTVHCSNAGNTSGINITSSSTYTRRMMIIGTGGTSTGIAHAGTLNKIERNVVTGFAQGLVLNQYGNGSLFANNLFAKNSAFGVDTIYGTASSILGYFYNNISIGNGTNWRTPMSSSVEGGDKNAGLTGEAWLTGSGTRITLATTDFAGYAGDDFRPALSTSPQVEVGTTYYQSIFTDVADDVVPSYINGTTDKFDVGAYEFDQGNGLKPNAVTVAGSGMITASRIKIAKQSDGTELRNVVLGSTSDSYSQNASSDIPVYIYLRKGSAAPYYKPVRLSATITAAGGLTYDVSGLQIPDIAASTYAAGVATDWTLNTTTGAIVHASGSTRYSVQDLYSYHQNYTDDNATVDDMLLMDGTTPTVFSLVNSGAITDADHQYLYGGSISEASGATLWSNIYSVGGLAGSPTIYIYQGSTKLTNYWAAGHVDLLLKVKASSALISSGLVTGFSRKWGYTYDHYEVDLSGGGRNVMPLATLADANNQTARATVAAYSGITVTFGTYSRDFGDGGGLKTYYCEIDCNNLPVSQIYEYTKYLTDEDNVSTLNGVPGNRYLSAHSSVAAIKSSPFGVFAGGTLTCAPTVWLKNVPGVDATKYIVTDSAGVSHQNVQTPGSISATVLAGSRVRVFNVTQGVEINNVINADTSYSYAITTEAIQNDVIKVFVCKLGYTETVATGVFDVVSGYTALVSQVLDPTYAAWGIDGSTVSEFTLDVTGTIEIDANDADGATLKTRLGAWYNYILTTADGIRYLFGAISYLSTAAIRINTDVINLQIENTNAAVALRFTDLDVRLYRSNGTSIIAPTSYSIHNDYSGVPDVVETGVSGLTTGESNQLMSLPTSTMIWNTDVSGAGSSTAASTYLKSALTKSQFIGLK